MVLLVLFLSGLVTGSIFIGDWQEYQAAVRRERAQHIRALERELLGIDEVEEINA